MLPKPRFLTAGFAVATAQHVFAAVAPRARSLSPMSSFKPGSREKTIMKPTSKDTARRLSAVAFVSIMLPLWPFGASAADNKCTSEEPAYRITLPGPWIAASRDGIVHYQSPSRTEAVTAAVYEFKGFADEAGRIELMMKSLEMRRGLERERSGGNLELSEVTRDRLGGLPRLRYAGEDIRTHRRFADLIVSSPHCMQNFYYEAVGLSQHEFERTARNIFRSLEIPDKTTLDRRLSAAGVLNRSLGEIQPPPLPGLVPGLLPK